VCRVVAVEWPQCAWLREIDNSLSMYRLRRNLDRNPRRPLDFFFVVILIVILVGRSGRGRPKFGRRTLERTDQDYDGDHDQET